MRFHQPMFAFIYEGKRITVIQASSKREARARAQLIAHLQVIPPRSKVQMLRPGTIHRGPVFFEGHFRAIEDARIEDDVLQHHRITTYSRA